MVNFCAIIGCSNHAKRDKVSFFRLPAVITSQDEKTRELSNRRRLTWLSRISRDFQKTSLKYIRICSDHFASGKPAYLYKETDVDWAPSLKLGHHKQMSTPTPERGIRNKDRQGRIKHMMAARSLLTLLETNPETEEQHNATCDLPGSVEPPAVVEPPVVVEPPAVAETGTSCQTQLGGSLLKSMESELNRLTGENVDLRQQLDSTRICDAMFKDDDDKVRLYTGLPTYCVLMTLFMFIEPFLPHTHKSALSKFQQLMLTVMRLKMNLPGVYIADKFGISPGTVSTVFAKTLHVLFTKLKPLVYWPEREELRKTMPFEFRKHFGLNVAVIIDCFEIFIERPSNLMARAQTWSSYKHHNTVKYLIGIAPQGVISYISKGYGGRASDKFITNDCGMLDKLVYGDVVLADRGFDIADSVAQVSAELRIPAFTKGKSQLSALDVERTRKIAHVRIHVERVIGLARNKYKILHDTLPIDYLHSQDGSVPTIDKIVTVCCALTNLCKSVVPFN